MLISKDIINDLYNNIDEEKIDIAKRYNDNDKIKIVKAMYDDNKNFELYAKADGHRDTHNVYVKAIKNEISDVKCTCKDYLKSYESCEHILAAVLKFENSEEYSNIFEKKDKKSTKIYDNSNKYKTFNQIINTFYDELCQSEQKEKRNGKETLDLIEIDPKIIYDSTNKEMCVEFKVGDGKNSYKIKNLITFFDTYQAEETFKYGQKLEFKHTRGIFKTKDLALLDFVLRYSEIIKYTNESIGQQRYYGKVMNESMITISNTCLDEMFDVFEGKYIKIKKDYEEDKILFLDEPPEIKFILEEADEKDYKLYPNIDIYGYEVLYGKKYLYIIIEDVIYRCPMDYKNTVLKLLELFKNNFTKEVLFKKEELPKLFSLVIPSVRKNLEIKNINSDEMEKYIPQDLYVKLYLDSNENNYITADVKFGYKDYEFNPLIGNPKIQIARDIVKETKTLETFIQTGFMLDKEHGNLVLADDEKIYNFLSEEFTYYMKNFEILATENFKKKEIKRPQISNIGIKIENDLLKVNLNEFNFSPEELAEIMEKYKLRKKYYKLKDGSFINLEENEALEFLDKINIDGTLDYKKIVEGEIDLPVYRTLYLDKILKNTSMNVYKNKEYKELVTEVQDANDDYIKIPQGLKATLRRYQEVGYKWLKTLDKYGLGGILADDMGLGKTIQVIALLLDYVENTEKRKTSIVVCPSSLALNWYNEINKFAPDLKVMVISGNAEDRAKKIKDCNNFDIIITSYDLLKRDIDVYTELDYEFKFIIADEAQYIKNNNTQNFKAIKKVKAMTRFALTGTPIENSLAELWSIFDFSMPGYLYNYRKFKESFETPIIREEDSYKTRRLKMLIEPFILRRVKEEVLTELPDKTVTVLNSEMEEEQQKVYMSYMAEAREEVENELIAAGFERNQMKILALLMRLRQICCHPSLFINNYDGGSGKLNQCMEIIKDAVQSNHKILLFSGYTSMFDIIEPELEKENIKYFKLTGQTKVSERMELVEEFNENKDVKVFLISLKAGGTGLNLIGADMVIHYDPWWNISAENQATDRTYRIGQKRNVQVYKLITKNSIEEKIYELQQKKAKLVDNMLSTNETFISKLSKDEIMDLFK